MRGNTITMQLVAGKTAKSEPLYQYDYGQKLVFAGMELPAVYEVHFGRSDIGSSVTMIGGADGVDIPDDLLLSGASVNVWVYLHAGEDDGETEFRGQIPVIRRAKPTHDEPTPVQQSEIEQAIAALNAAVESTSEDAAAAEAAAEASEGSAEDAEGSAEDAEAWAIGKRGGVDVPSTDPTYHNNAKFYDYEANTAAWNANACVRLAQTAQGKAETAQGLAETAQAAAEAAQAAAATSESNALISKQAAALSASNANTAKNDAVAAKNNAASSASAASNAASNASSSKNSAANSASNAASAKTAAQAAQAAAESAQGKAEDAQEAAETAQGKAEDAQEAAETAAAAAVANVSLAPAYSTSATYKVGDYVLYNNALYRCTTAIATAEAWTAAHWTAAKIGPDVCDLKSALSYDKSMMVATDKSEITTTWAQGKLSGSSAYHIRSGFINLVSGDIIGVQNSAKYAFEIGEYDSSGTMLELSDTTNLFVADRDMRIRIQLHDTNAILSILPAAGSNVIFLRNYSGAIAHIPEIDAEIESMEDDIDAINAENSIFASMESIVLASCTDLPGCFYYEGGQSITENANWNAKKVITDGNREFIISADTTTATDGIYVLSFYDSSNALLDHLYPLNATVPTIKSMPIRVPDGTAYFFINSYQSEPIVYVNCSELLKKAIAREKIQKIGTISGKIYNPATNQFVENVNYTTDIYDIKSGTKYYISNVLRAATGFYSVLYFTSKTTFNADTYISAEYPVLKSLTIYPNVQCPLTIPANAVCFQLVYFNTDASYTGSVFTDISGAGVSQISILSHLNGKKVTVIGDSITEYNYRAAINWAMWLEKWTGCIVQNLGISGTGFMRSNPYVNRITNINSDCDIIGVAASLNDLSGNSVIGTPTDTQQDNTVLGYANTFFTTLQSSYPSTPIICYMENPWEVYHTGVQRSDDYVTGIAQVCKNHGIPFYDGLYSNGSVLRPWVYQNRLVYFTSDNPQYPSQTGTVDNVHPNSKGMNIIAGYLQNKFEQNVVYD